MASRSFVSAHKSNIKRDCPQDEEKAKVIKIVNQDGSCVHLPKGGMTQKPVEFDLIDLSCDYRGPGAEYLAGPCQKLMEEDGFVSLRRLNEMLGLSTRIGYNPGSDQRRQSVR